MGRLTHPSYGSLVVSCEHASNRVPPAYRNLGLSRAHLSSHIAWDPGARRVARAIAKQAGSPLLEARWTRLVVDLNRSVHHRSLIAHSSFGIEVPGNRDLDAAERERRIRRYWHPYREAARRAVAERVAATGICLHLSVHSFTPEVDGAVRGADIGLLSDPARPLERNFAAGWAANLKKAGLRARRNYPYRGTSDGLVTAFRREFPRRRYLGVELEINQRFVADPGEFVHMLDVTLTTFLDSLLDSLAPRRRRP